MLSELPSYQVNPFLCFQHDIAKSPAYHLIAVPLHLGLVAKARQILKACPSANLALLLRDFSSGPRRIACTIPAQSARTSLADYTADEFDAIIHQVIGQLTPERRVRHSDYSPVTRATFWRDWKAMFYATADQSAFYFQAPRPQVLPPRWGEENLADPESLPANDPARLVFLSKATADENNLQFAQVPDTLQTKRVFKRKHYLTSERAVLDRNPSTLQPGCLPLPVLALVVLGMNDARESLGELNWRTARTLIGLLIHTGRRCEWVQTLRLGSPSNRRTRLPAPLYDSHTHTIHVWPEIQLGIPSSLMALSLDPANANQETVASAWEKHDKVYEPISLVHSIRLPVCLATIIDEMLTDRSVKVGEALLLWTNEGKTESLRAEICQNILGSLSSYIQRFIPDHPDLRFQHFARTFIGYYTDLGLDAEYQYYISGRARTEQEMPLRYSLVRAEHLARVYAMAYQKFVAMLDTEIEITRSALKAESSFLQDRVEQ
jgi:hypothetical protein